MNNYNDFPILDEQVYRYMTEQYNKVKDFDRRNIVGKIFIQLNECKKSCYCLVGKFNSKIKEVVENAKSELDIILENYQLTFGSNFDVSNEVKNVGLFSFLKKLTSIILQLEEWLTLEEKDYYKKIADNTLVKVTNVLLNFMSAIEQSNLLLFKYM